MLLSRLTAIRDHSSGMKSLQKKAFVKRLLQSSVLGDVPTWPPYFLSSILPLLPYLPVSHFQQLTSQQVRGQSANFNIISVTDVSHHRHDQVIIQAMDWGSYISADDKLREKSKYMSWDASMQVVKATEGFYGLRSKQISSKLRSYRRFSR